MSTFKYFVGASIAAASAACTGHTPEAAKTATVTASATPPPITRTVDAATHFDTTAGPTQELQSGVQIATGLWFGHSMESYPGELQPDPIP
jgi:hypothetical protein